VAGSRVFSGWTADPDPGGASIGGTESATDYVFIINAGGVPGRCRVTEYSQDEWYLGIGTVKVTGCREASVTGKGVVLSCPNLSGPVLIPPVVTRFPAT
jgi:hypothetical protein